MNSRWPMKKRNNCAVSMRLWLPDPILSMNLRLLQSLDQRYVGIYKCKSRIVLLAILS